MEHLQWSTCMGHLQWSTCMRHLWWSTCRSYLVQASEGMIHMTGGGAVSQQECFTTDRVLFGKNTRGERNSPHHSFPDNDQHDPEGEAKESQSCHQMLSRNQHSSGSSAIPVKFEAPLMFGISDDYEQMVVHGSIPDFCPIIGRPSSSRPRKSNKLPSVTFRSILWSPAGTPPTH